MGNNDIKEIIEDAKHDAKEKLNGVRGKIDEIEKFVDNEEPIADDAIFQVADDLKTDVDEAANSIIECFDEVKRMREMED